MYRIIPRFTASPLQAFSYLAGVALFSISFLVFLNASISFVITDVIGQRKRVGDAVGTLGFADELVALVACPLWGLISDRIGVRWVAVAGYCVIGFSLICLVQSGHVYPDLLLWRMLFSVGGAACSTMVTAILPAMTLRTKPEQRVDGGYIPQLDHVDDTANNRNSVAASVSSDMTITPARFTRQSSTRLWPRRNYRSEHETNPKPGADEIDPAKDASRLAGFVGMFTGIGALVALILFLPLPTFFAKETSKAQSVQDSFYTVGAVSFIVAVLVGFGLKDLPGESSKSLRNFFHASSLTKSGIVEQENGKQVSENTYISLTKSAILLGFTDADIATGYLGGFVARASSVAISTFIPLFVNAYFIRNGLCSSDPSSELRQSCERAYKVAAMLTGISQLVALVSAPLYGFFNARYAIDRRLSRLPLAISAAAGIAGYLAFSRIRSPDPKIAGGHGVFIAVILIGISQIGAIVCSLGILAKGVQHGDPARSSESTAAQTHAKYPTSNGTASAQQDAGATEASPLLLEPGLAALQSTGGSSSEDGTASTSADRAHLKGSIAGMYSLSGGLAILILNKLGGWLFDSASPSGPFYLMAGFNAVLLVALVGMEVIRTLRVREESQMDDRVASEGRPTE